MNIVMVSSEVSPFSKSGGMGDVVAALSTGLAAQKNTVLVVSPRYAGIEKSTLVPTNIEV